MRVSRFVFPPMLLAILALSGGLRSSMRDATVRVVATKRSSRRAALAVEPLTFCWLTHVVMVGGDYSARATFIVSVDRSPDKSMATIAPSLEGGMLFIVGSQFPNSHRVGTF